MISSTTSIAGIREAHVDNLRKGYRDRVKQHIPPYIKTYTSNAQQNSPLAFEYNQAMAQKSSIDMHLL